MQISCGETAVLARSNRDRIDRAEITIQLEKVGVTMRMWGLLLVEEPRL